jgi:hypothetical protein
MWTFLRSCFKAEAEPTRQIQPQPKRAQTNPAREAEDWHPKMSDAQRRLDMSLLAALRPYPQLPATTIYPAAPRSRGKC